MDQRGVQIEIEMAEEHRGLTAGPHIVSYMAFADGTLWCLDENGERHVLEQPVFRFVKVSWFDTRISESGRVSIKLGEVWIDLGPMLIGHRGSGCLPVARNEGKEIVGARALTECLEPDEVV